MAANGSNAQPETVTVHLALNLAAVVAAIYMHCGICPNSCLSSFNSERTI